MGIKRAIPALAGGIVALQALLCLIPPSADPIRPPGAKDEADFLAKCIKCGRCIEACPYVALVCAPLSAGLAAGTPQLDVREQACRLCEDFPCTQVCPTEALLPVGARDEVDMGLAVIDPDLCIAFEGMRCEVCYRACPLIDVAITLDYRMREGDAIHSVFAPLIDAERCVGCGLCVERCVVGEPAVAIEIVRDRKRAIQKTEELAAKHA